MPSAEFDNWKRQRSVEAKLLKEIVFKWRVSKAQVRNKGGRWFATTVDELCRSIHKEGYHLPVHRTMKRYVRRLEDDGYVTRTKAKFAGPKPILFVRPTFKALAALGSKADVLKLQSDLESDTSSGTVVSPQVSPHSTVCVPNGVPDHSLPTSLPNLYQEQPSVGAHAPGPNGSSENVHLSASEDVMAKMEFSSVAEAVAGFEKPTPDVKDKDIANLWRAGVLEVTDLAYVNLSNSEKTRLREAKKLMPPNLSGEIVYWTLKHWSFFTGKAKEAAGVYTVPELPEVFFFKRHVNIATNLYLHDVQAELAKAVVKPKVEEPKMTADELEALTKDDDE